MFLSVGACKKLGLIHQEFPHHTENVVPTASVCAMPTDVSQEERPPPQRPDRLPVPASEENVEKLERFLVQQFQDTAFNTDAAPLPAMDGTPHTIHLLPGAVPYARHVPIPVSKHWEKEVRAQLDEDERRGIIEKVPAGEPTEWCAPMVVVPKANGRPRRTVDYQELNKFCKRETHHTRNPFDMVSSVPRCTYKTTLDAFSGFHQVPLADCSKPLTTFITPWGRYRYRRTPMGHVSASDAYTKRYDDAIEGTLRMYKCVDDVLLYDYTIEDAFWHCWEYLEACVKRGITLSADKFRFCRREVDFVGYQLCWENFRPAGDKLAAVADFPMPEQPTITDIRSFMGLVNQIAPFMITSPLMEPFRELLKGSTSKKVYWDDQLRAAFEQAKRDISKLISCGLQYYDTNRPTVLMTDWSRQGIGFVVLQQYCSCTGPERPSCCRDGWKLALCGSRHLTPAEQNYAAVEGEATSIVWALHKARLFLLGCDNLEIITDHKPLARLFADRQLKDITNPRLFRLKEKTLNYKFTIRYKPGRLNTAADALSRYPVQRVAPSQADVDLAEELTTAAVTAIPRCESDGNGVTVDQDAVKEEAAKDPTYQLLQQKVSSDTWVTCHAKEASELKAFFKVRDRLSLVDGLVCYSYDGGALRLVIPAGLQLQVARNLHAAHQGKEGMIRRAREAVYWPGFEADIEFHRLHCNECCMKAPTQPAEPAIMTKPPDYPFQKVVADLFDINGHSYLVYSDRLTGWIKVEQFRSTSSHVIIPALRKYFSQYGVPEEISIDGGTNLTSSAVRDFFRRWKVEVRQSSAYYPKSNGRAEAAVRSAKAILRGNTSPGGGIDTDKVVLALLQYHNTPLRDGDKSPAQLLMGRQLRGGVPVPNIHLRVAEYWQDFLQERELQMAKTGEVTEERTRSLRELPPLKVGQCVRMQDPRTRLWDRTGIVTGVNRKFRQYTIRLDGTGRITRRNRRFIKPIATAEKAEGALRP